MKFELDDDTVLKIGGALSVATGAHLYSLPKEAMDFWCDKEQPRSEPLARWLGLSSACAGAQTLTIGFSEGCKDAKKDLLKVGGFTSLAVAAQSAYCANENQIKPEIGYTYAALNVALGALALWRGFKDEDKED